MINFDMPQRWAGFAPVMAQVVGMGRYRGVAVSGPRRP